MTRDVAPPHDTVGHEVLEVTFEHSHDGILVINPHTESIVAGNPAAAQLLGYDREELSGLPVSAIHPDNLEQFREFATEVLQNGTGWTADMTCYTADGNELPAQVSAGLSVINDERHIVAIVRDVTDRREREQALQRKTEQLETFAKIVSHDLRNPLDVIQSRLSLARAECESPSEHLEIINRAVDRAVDIIEDTLTLVEHGGVAADTDLIDLAEAATTSWDLVATQNASLDCCLEGQIMADSDRLSHLFENLFRNAMEHSGKSPPYDALTVTVDRNQNDSGFHIADNGQGFSEDPQRLFEPGRTTQRDGTGFGLAIVERVAEAHGWQVTAGPSADGGARFDIIGPELA